MAPPTEPIDRIIRAGNNSQGSTTNRYPPYNNDPEVVKKRMRKFKALVRRRIKVVSADKDTYVAKSKISGASLGLFANKDFRNGDEVAKYVGEYIPAVDTDEFHEYSLAICPDANGRDIIEIDASDEWNYLGRFANGSVHTITGGRPKYNVEFDVLEGTCDANRPEGSPAIHPILTATKHIAKDTEIIANYQDAYWLNFTTLDKKTPFLPFEKSWPTHVRLAKEASAKFAAKKASRRPYRGKPQVYNIAYDKANNKSNLKMITRNFSKWRGNPEKWELPGWDYN